MLQTPSFLWFIKFNASLTHLLTAASGSSIRGILQETSGNTWKEHRDMEVEILKISSDMINYLARLIYHWIAPNSYPQNSQYRATILLLWINVFYISHNNYTSKNQCWKSVNPIYTFSGQQRPAIELRLGNSSSTSLLVSKQPVLFSH